jgi:hypothetical protein
MTWAKPRVAALAAAVALLAAAPAAADETPDDATCRKAYEQGQRLRRAKKLLDARRDFMLCARAPCPAVFQPECAKWLGEVQEEMPTVVVVVEGMPKDARASVQVDGAPFSASVDGIARPLDPGIHEIRATVGREQIVEHATVVEGAKAQRIVLRFPSNERAPARATRRRPTPWIVVAGSVGAVALGSFAYFGIRGLSLRSDVLDCTPNCPSSEIDDARRHLLLADVSLGVSALAFGAAAYLYFSRSSDPAATALRSWPIRF